MSFDSAMPPQMMNFIMNTALIYNKWCIAKPNILKQQEVQKQLWTLLSEWQKRAKHKSTHMSSTIYMQTNTNQKITNDRISDE